MGTTSSYFLREWLCHLYWKWRNLFSFFSEKIIKFSHVATVVQNAITAQERKKERKKERKQERQQERKKEKKKEKVLSDNTEINRIKIEHLETVNKERMAKF